MMADTFAVALGRKPAPKSWFDSEAEFQQSETDRLNARLRQMMMENLPRGYR
jgi:hypothetical protein